MKIIYPDYSRINVYKSFIVVCIATINDKNITSYQEKNFSTFTGDLHRCTE